MENIYIQFMDGGNWRNSSILPATASAQRILIEMQSVQRMYPNYRIRAADEAGRMIDKL